MTLLLITDGNAVRELRDCVERRTAIQPYKLRDKPELRNTRISSFLFLFLNK